MRVTDNMLINKFSRNLNAAVTNLDSANDQVSTGMKFSKASQDPSGAMKAFMVRRSLSRIQQYQSNIKDVQGVLDQTESTLMGIQDILTQAKESLVQGSNGTMSDDNRKTVSDIFTNLQDQLLKLANTNYAGKYILGGPNTTTPPFTLDAGNLFYNGQDLSGGSVSSESVYADVGLGLKFDASGSADSRTAISVSTPGSEVLGYGTDANGLPNNTYLLFSDIINSLNTNDMSKINMQIDKLSQKSDDILVQVADIGERSQYVDFLNNRFSTDQLNLQKKQNDLETVDQATAITNYKSAELTYQASLQMGSKLVQTSLLDFLK